MCQVVSPIPKRGVTVLRTILLLISFSHQNQNIKSWINRNRCTKMNLLIKSFALSLSPQKKKKYQARSFELPVSSFLFSLTQGERQVISPTNHGPPRHRYVAPGTLSRVTTTNQIPRPSSLSPARLYREARNHLCVWILPCCDRQCIRSSTSVTLPLPEFSSVRIKWITL